MQTISNPSDFTPRPSSSLSLSLSLSIQPSPSGHHLTHHSTQSPYFWLADTAWEAFHRLDKEQVGMYLRNRKEKGFGVVMMVVLAEHGGLDLPNRYGAFPFHPLPPTTTTATTTSESSTYKPDITRPNRDYFDFVDYVIDEAGKLGMLVALVPTWGRYVNGGYYKNPPLFTPSTGYTLCHFLGSRYPFLPFILGGDSNRFWSDKFDSSEGKDVELVDYGDVVEAMARGLIDGEGETISKMQTTTTTTKTIKETKPYKTFIIYHSAQPWFSNSPISTGSAQFPTSEWLTLDACQTGHQDTSNPRRPAPGDLTQADAPPFGQTGAAPKSSLQMWQAKSSYVPIRRMYSTPRPDGHPRPVLDLEPHYEATHHWFARHMEIWGEGDVRKGAWQALFAGACGLTYGCNSIWQFHDEDSKTHPPIAPPTTAYTNWYLELDLPGAFQMTTARQIILSLPGSLYDRIPDSTFILSERYEVGPDDELRHPAGDKLIAGMRSEKGEWAMVHLPYGGKVEVDVGKGLKAEGKYRAWWVDPRIGGRQVIGTGAAVNEMSSKATFDAPDDKDWLLLLEAVSS